MRSSHGGRLVMTYPSTRMPFKVGKETRSRNVLQPPKIPGIQPSFFGRSLQQQTRSRRRRPSSSTPSSSSGHAVDLSILLFVFVFLSVYTLTMGTAGGSLATIVVGFELPTRKGDGCPSTRPQEQTYVHRRWDKHRQTDKEQRHKCLQDTWPFMCERDDRTRLLSPDGQPKAR